MVECWVSLILVAYGFTIRHALLTQETKWCGAAWICYKGCTHSMVAVLSFAAVAVLTQNHLSKSPIEIKKAVLQLRAKRLSHSSGTVVQCKIAIRQF